jgi:hypothetical protein
VRLPSIGACASHEDWLGVQSVIVVLGLQIGDREAKRSGDTLRRGQFVGNRVAKGEARELAQRGGGHNLTLLPGLVEGNALSEELGADGG